MFCQCFADSSHCAEEVLCYPGWKGNEISLVWHVPKEPMPMTTSHQNANKPPVQPYILALIKDQYNSTRMEFLETVLAPLTKNKYVCWPFQIFLKLVRHYWQRGVTSASCFHMLRYLYLGSNIQNHFPALEAILLTHHRPCTHVMFPCLAWSVLHNSHKETLQ